MTGEKFNQGDSKKSHTRSSMRSSDRFFERANEPKTPRNDVSGSTRRLEAAAEVGHDRNSAGSPKATRPMVNGSTRTKEGSASSRPLNPRPSRWADEVDEEDQFRPTQKKISAAVPSQVAEKSLPLRVPAASSSRRAVQPAAKHSEPRSKVNSKRQERRVIEPVSSARAVVAVEISEISEMKQTMARKAEERKKLKEEEEAHIEADRRARCQAKLREIEERQKSRTNSVMEEKTQNHQLVETSNTDSRRQSPTVALSPVEIMPAADYSQKRTLFNDKRRELRQMRDADRGEPSEIVPPAAILSPHAQEFYPSSSSTTMHIAPPPPPHMVHMQWQQHHMMGMQMPHAPYGFPPQFHPYGYPPHGMPPPQNQYY